MAHHRPPWITVHICSPTLFGVSCRSSSFLILFLCFFLLLCFCVFFCWFSFLFSFLFLFLIFYFSFLFCFLFLFHFPVVLLLFSYYVFRLLFISFFESVSFPFLFLLSFPCSLLSVTPLLTSPPFAGPERIRPARGRVAPHVRGTARGTPAQYVRRVCIGRVMRSGRGECHVTVLGLRNSSDSSSTGHAVVNLWQCEVLLDVSCNMLQQSHWLRCTVHVLEHLFGQHMYNCSALYACAACTCFFGFPTCC